MKYYFCGDDEMCYTKEWHIRQAMENGECTHLTLREGVPTRGTGFFFCRAVDEVGEDGECGRDCEGYAPKNGVSGMCHHKARLYEPGKEVVVKIPKRKDA